MTSKTYVLLETEVEKTKAVVTSIKALKEVKTVNIITGPFDVIVYFEAEDSQIIGTLIIEKLRPLDGVKRTLDRKS
ncbi:MAG TPA: AsnC family transcriptional regulator, partial [Anaerolineae bacterium]|nr:AsnC family transcriptional regulator [Anaerolineae bacterium]